MTAEQERHALACLAIGRILRLGSRPEQPGDIAEYDRCRAIVLDASPSQPEEYRPRWVRDRLKGAAGD